MHTLSKHTKTQPHTHSHTTTVSSCDAAEQPPKSTCQSGTRLATGSQCSCQSAVSSSRGGSSSGDSSNNNTVEHTLVANAAKGRTREGHRERERARACERQSSSESEKDSDRRESERKWEKEREERERERRLSLCIKCLSSRLSTFIAAVLTKLKGKPPVQMCVKCFDHHS